MVLTNCRAQPAAPDNQGAHPAAQLQHGAQPEGPPTAEPSKQSNPHLQSTGNGFDKIEILIDADTSRNLS